VAFRDGAFGKLLGFDKVTRMEFPWLNTSGFMRYNTRVCVYIHTQTYTNMHTPCLLPCDCPVPPWDSASRMVTTRCRPLMLNQNQEPKKLLFSLTYPVAGIVQLAIEIKIGPQKNHRKE
jgi:hypothetical protein